MCWSPVVGAILALVAVCFQPLLAADEVPDLAALVGKTIDIQLKNRTQLADLEVVKAVPGTEATSLKLLSVKPAKPTKGAKPQTIPAANIEEIFVEGEPLDLEFDKKTKTLSHSPEKRTARIQHEAEVKQRLAGQRHKLWPELTQAEHDDWIAKHRQFMKEASEKMPGVRFQLVETKFYLFYTDMPAETVGVYVAYLDAMYVELCKAFAIPAGKNIWCGKCVVVAFQEEATFAKFESEVMKYGKVGAQGLCHGSYDGRVIITCWKGKQDVYFADVLVHETAHGFVHRWKSSVHIPSWVNEGISDWIAAMIVKDEAVARKQKESVTKIRQTGSMGGTFFDETQNIEFWQYGAASSLVEMMLRMDASKYRDFLTGIKEGLTAAESLKKSYGMSKEEILKKYGQLAGIPNLLP